MLKQKNIKHTFKNKNVIFEYFVDSEQNDMLKSIQNKETPNLYAAFRSISGKKMIIEKDVIIKKMLTETKFEGTNPHNKLFVEKSIAPTIRQTNSFIHMTSETIKYFIDEVISKRKCNIFDDMMKPTLCELIFSNCRFFMDIESLKVESNKMINWDIVTNNIISFVKIYLPKYFLSDEQMNYSVYHLVLDSSSREKFSRHLIFYLCINGQEVLFPEHLVFKDFLERSLTMFKDLVNETMQTQDDPKITIENTEFFDEGLGISELFVCSEKNACVIDLSVYTTYRNMRIPCCAKIDGERYLLPVSFNYPAYPAILKLINIVESYMFDEKGNIKYTEDMTPVDRYTLLSKINTTELHEIGLINRFKGWDKIQTIKINRYTERVDQSGLRKRKILKANGDTARVNIAINRMNKTRVVDKKITDIFNTIRENVKLNKDIADKYSHLFEKELKTTEIYEDGTGISFLNHNKFCLLLNREHKNNHSVIVLSTTNLCVYQWCFDDECKKRMNMFNLIDILPIDLLLKTKEDVREYIKTLLASALDKDGCEEFKKKMDKETLIFN